MDAQKLRKIIAPIVEAEVRRVLPRLIKESLGGMMLKNMIPQRQTLRESVETEEEVTPRRVPRTRNQLAEMLGYDPQSMGLRVAGVPSAKIPSTGPDGERFDTNRVSPTLKKALTRDYSALMKALEAKKNG